MAISIIIPAYYAEAFIARAVGSVLAQTIPDFEIIIASDDGQNYLAILKQQGISDSRIQMVSTGGIGKGAAVARNFALEAARGKIIASLDADDAFLPTYLEIMAPLAAEHGMAVSQVAFIDHETGQALPNLGKPYSEGALALEDVLLACAHTFAPLVFDRARVTHRWNEPLPLLEDVVFFAESYAALPAAWYASAPLYRYFHRQDSQCNSADAAQRFLDAGKRITALLDNGIIAAKNPHVRAVLKAYVERNNQIERAFERALSAGEVSGYQEFTGRNLALLHSPLIATKP